MKIKIMFIIVTMFLFGCTHGLEIKNLNDFKTVPIHSDKSFKVAVTSFNGSYEFKEYYSETVNSLNLNPNISQVKENWNISNMKDEFKPDYIVTLNLNEKFSGSDYNLPITFPGFLVFACAWNGYMYNAEVNTNVQISSLVPEKKMENVFEETVSMNFDIRHCDFERGFWSGTGWWFPGYGFHNIITGAVFIKYDTDVTMPFIRQSSRIYGQYMSNKIVNSLIQMNKDK